MIEANVIIAGHRARVSFDPAGTDPYSAVRTTDPLASVAIVNRMREAIEIGSPVGPLGPFRRHPVPPWTDRRELALALIGLLDNDDPLAQLLRDDPELAELTRLPEGDGIIV